MLRSCLCVQRIKEISKRQLMVKHATEMELRSARAARRRDWDRRIRLRG